jgi:hypothetical protein
VRALVLLAQDHGNSLEQAPLAFGARGAHP